MLSVDDHPGLFYFMAGIVVIVMTAVGLSLLIDRRFAFSSSIVEAKAGLLADEEVVKELRAQVFAQSKHLADSDHQRESASKAFRLANSESKTLAQRKELLLKSRADLHVEIGSLEREFLSYRQEYRRKSRAAAAGEVLGNLKVQSGRVYQNAVLIRVTDAGMEIRHEDGIARIQAPDLDARWQDRFQWDEEGRKRLLESEMRSSAGVEIEAPAAEPSVQDSRRQANDEKLRLLQKQVLNWMARESQLSNEQSDAASRAGYGSQSSAPGSLETWSARSARLARELSRARIELQLARASLAEVAPGDPLLRTVLDRD